MTSNWRTWMLVGLGIAVVIAAIYFPILRKRVKTTAKIPEPTEEQARRELTQPVTQNPSDPVVKVKLFWTSSEDESALAPVTIQLALSKDPVLRAKQVLNTLLAGPVDSDLRTLPPDAALLAFYLLPDGTAIADFSEALATSTPSGIQSEQMAVDSIARTLEANVPQVRRLKILIHGQELDTLAGHVDLTQMFIVDTKAAQQGAISLDPARIAIPAAVSPSPGAAPIARTGSSVVTAKEPHR
ncbi:MAG TPA: GerMN domain-containing protein [Candidatus Acidoferrum sp.]